jgi:hypothetical protein
MGGNIKGEKNKRFDKVDVAICRIKVKKKTRIDNEQVPICRKTAK